MGGGLPSTKVHKGHVAALVWRCMDSFVTKVQQNNEVCFAKPNNGCLRGPMVLQIYYYVAQTAPPPLLPFGPRVIQF